MTITVPASVVSDLVSALYNSVEGFWPIFTTIFILSAGFFVVDQIIDIAKKTV